MSKPKLPASDEREIAVAASVDPRTLRKAIAGGSVQPMPMARIRAALKARGMLHLLPSVES